MAFHFCVMMAVIEMKFLTFIVVFVGAPVFIHFFLFFFMGAVFRPKGKSLNENKVVSVNGTGRFSPFLLFCPFTHPPN